MKYFLCLILVLTALHSVASAQEPPPPPPPLIYKAPDKSDFKEIVSEDERFQITFPGIPKITKQDLENAFVTIYSVYRQGSNSVVNTYDFKFDIEENKEKIFELFKNSILKNTKAKIESEKEIQIEGIPGKEFDVHNNLQYQKVRIFVSGNTLYEIATDVTNWHIIGDSTKKLFFDESERFFNSFKIINSQKIVTPVANKDLLGSISNNIYRNAFFNFTIEFSPEWYSLNQTEIQGGKNLGQEALKTENEKLNKELEEAVKKETVILAISEKTSGSNLAVGALKQPNNQITSEEVIAATRNFFLKNPNVKLIKDLENININGKRFSTVTLETNINGITINQKLLTTIQKGYSLTFVFTYGTKAGLDLLNKVMQTLKFDPK
jgi:hypothetical protein